MKCPECDTKLSTKHYDAAFEWYECPKCEGCFTYDEILEGGIDESDESEDRREQGNSRSTPRKKKAGGRGKERKNAGRKNTQASARNGKPVAKGKVRRQRIEAEEERAEELTKEIVENAVRSKDVTHHRDELSTGEVIGIWGDEIQDIYEELGSRLDEINARDKALIIWRETRYMHGAVAREQEVTHVLCKEHR